MLDARIKPGFHIVVPVVRKKFIGQIQLCGNLPYNCSIQEKWQIQRVVRDRMNSICPMNFFRTTDDRYNKYNDMETRLKVVLWSKFCIPFSLHFWEAEVLSTYHAKFYLKIRTGSQVILTLTKHSKLLLVGISMRTPEKISILSLLNKKNAFVSLNGVRRHQ